MNYKINKLLYLLKNFGLRVSFWSTLSSLYPWVKKKNSLSMFIFNHMNQVIAQWVEKEFWSDSYKEIPFPEEQDLSHHIWTFWWQGFEDAPDCIKLSIAMMKQNSNGAEVHVLSKDNWNDYVHLSDTIIYKLESGAITLQHFSDILRVNLLERYGGLWLDAGIFPLKPVSNDIFEYNFYSRKAISENEPNISKGAWCFGLMAGKKHFPVFKIMSDIFNRYWDKYEQLIHYFFNDYMTAVIYNKIASFRDLITNLPENNENLFLSEKDMHKPYTPEIYLNFIESTDFVRVTWKNHYETETPDGSLTIFGFLLKRIEK